MSNVKAGDLAFIRRCREAPALTGRLVEVLSLAPVGVSFRLPGGKSHEPVEPGRWICRLVGAPFSVPCEAGGFTVTNFLPIPDFALSPIRPQADDAECNSTAWLPPVPTKEVA